MKFCVTILVFIIFNVLTDQINGSETKIVSARLESCPGCQLNRLTDVKAFAYEDIPKYENVEFKKIQGAPPELVFLDEQDNEIERISLRTFDRKQCNDLLLNRGFKVKTKVEF